MALFASRRRNFAHKASGELERREAHAGGYLSSTGQVAHPPRPERPRLGRLQFQWRARLIVPCKQMGQFRLPMSSTLPATAEL